MFLWYPNHQTLFAASQQQWVQQTEVRFSHSVSSLRVINQQLWCCCVEAGIMVLDHSDLRHLQNIQTGERKLDHDLAMMADGDVVRACGKGLFHAKLDGKGVFFLNKTIQHDNRKSRKTWAASFLAL